MWTFIFLTSCFFSANLCETFTKTFPNDFLFGVGSSAYQIEGAWNESDKGISVWDYWTNTLQELVLDGSNGDVACNSYHKIKEDIKLLKELNVNFYRFSISWSRILPKGFSNYISQEGINYYKMLLNELKINGIKAMVTIHHFDLPKSLYDLGGWTNSAIINYFVKYAEIIFNNFGDSVDYWLTFNDPLSTCMQGDWISGISDYICMHHLLKAHAKVYHLAKNIKLKGNISIGFNSHWYEPVSFHNESNFEAAERALKFNLEWYTNPIYGNGDYPEIMKEIIEERSLKEGFTKSRLPVFSAEEINEIKETSDFFAISHFTTFLVADKEEEEIETASRDKDMRVLLFQDPAAPLGASEWFRVVPSGFRKILNWININYGKTIDTNGIFVIGNGYSDNGEIEDEERIKYHQLYLTELLDAIHSDEINIKAYTAWSFLDSFEWTEGYSHRFGLYHVNFKDPNRNRTMKSSAKFYKQVIESKTVG